MACLICSSLPRSQMQVVETLKKIMLAFSLYILWEVYCKPQTNVMYGMLSWTLSVYPNFLITFNLFPQAKKFDFVLVSVHLKAAGLGNSDLERLEVNETVT